MQAHFSSERSWPPPVPVADIPSLCRKWLWSDFNHSFHKIETGSYLLQERSEQGILIRDLRFFLERATTLSFGSRQEVSTITFMLQGFAEIKIQDAVHVALKEGQFNIMHVPGGIYTKSWAPAGESHLVQIFFPERNWKRYQNQFILSVELPYKKPVLLFDLKICKPVCYSAYSRALLHEFFEGNLTDNQSMSDILDKLIASCADDRNMHSTKIFTAATLEKIIEAKRIIDNWEGRPIDIKSLQRKVLLNVNLLKSGFKATFGRTIYGYQLDLRLEKARRLLTHSTLTIDAVAREIGYIDHSSFSKMFKQKFHMSPQQFRTQNSF